LLAGIERDWRALSDPRHGTTVSDREGRSALEALSITG